MPLMSSPTTLSLLSSTAAMLAYLLFPNTQTYSHVGAFALTVPTTWVYLLVDGSLLSFFWSLLKYPLISDVFPDYST